MSCQLPPPPLPSTPYPHHIPPPCSHLTSPCPHSHHHVHTYTFTSSFPAPSSLPPIPSSPLSLNLSSPSLSLIPFFLPLSLPLLPSLPPTVQDQETTQTVEVENSDSVLLVREGQNNVKLTCKIVPFREVSTCMYVHIRTCTMYMYFYTPFWLSWPT